jgi:hypothetical protein
MVALGNKKIIKKMRNLITFLLTITIWSAYSQQYSYLSIDNYEEMMEVACESDKKIILHLYEDYPKISAIDEQELKAIYSNFIFNFLPLKSELGGIYGYKSEMFRIIDLNGKTLLSTNTDFEEFVSFLDRVKGGNSTCLTELDKERKEFMESPSNDFRKTRGLDLDYSEDVDDFESYTVQFAVLSNKEKAFSHAELLESSLKINIFVVQMTINGKIQYGICSGLYDKEEADAISKEMNQTTRTIVKLVDKNFIIEGNMIKYK